MMELATGRIWPIKTHPIMRKNYVVPTPSIDGFYDRVRKCIAYGLSGSMLYGHPRFGKTSAIRYVVNMLSQEFPQVVAMSFLCLKSKSRSEAAFFSHLLEAVGHAQAHTGTISRKRSRLIHKLLERVERSGEHVLIIFADEAQRLDVNEYEWLRDVYDELDRHGVKVLVFLIGQPGLRNQKNALQETRQTQIVGRFMTHEIPFRGLLSVDDAATCLAGYDESCFPQGSDWTYTRFFLPKAYADGFRLVSQATCLWQAFLDAHEAARFTFELELPMKYFTQTVELALIQNAEHDTPDLRLSPAIWRDAVLESNYVTAQESVWSRLPDGLE
jgi:AAA domain-containing protein